MSDRQDGTTTPGASRLRLYVAAVLFVGMVALLVAPLNTGIAVHEWLGFAILVPFLIHLLVDWHWIVAVTRRFFSRLPARSRFNYCLDWLLFFMMTVAVVSGVLISESALPAVGIRIEVDPFWTGVHIINSRFLMMGLGVHLALHVGWVVGALRRSPGRSVPVTAPVERDGRLRSVTMRACLIVGVGVVMGLAILPLAGTDWAASFGSAVRSGLEGEVSRPVGLKTLITDLYWVAIIMGVPGSVTLAVLGVVRLLLRKGVAVVGVE